MPKPVRVILAYKNFALNKSISHIGLGISAINTAKVLRNRGIETEVWAIRDAKDLADRLSSAKSAWNRITHVNISAPWLASEDLRHLTSEYPNIGFAVVCHSNLGFLQADPNAMRLVREAGEIQRLTWNFHAAGNSRRFTGWVKEAYGTPCTYLPNLYCLDLDSPVPQASYRGGTLRIGTFGAQRPLKNFLTAAGAALQIGRELRTDLELWTSGGRNEGSRALSEAIQQMTAGLPNVKVMQNHWQSWPSFRQTVRHMHLLLQPSYTETFNVVTADGVAEGVPSVVSEAIEWAPKNWRAAVDDAGDIAHVGRRLIFDRNAALQGWRALKAHNEQATAAWLRYLGEPSPSRTSRWFRSAA